MIFNRDEYFANLGFNEDPFASTNAKHEKELENYFITPPYFQSLIGSFKTPKTSIVLAPRGAGKTAQRVMIEKISDKQNNILSIVYDNFPIENAKDLTKITLEKHLRRLLKYLLIGLISQSITKEEDIIFDKYDKKIINNLIREFLTGITDGELSQAISSIKGIKGKLFDIWHNTGESINSVINSWLKSKDMGNVDLKIKKKQRLMIQN